MSSDSVLQLTITLARAFPGTVNLALAPPQTIDHSRWGCGHIPKTKTLATSSSAGLHLTNTRTVPSEMRPTPPSPRLTSQRAGEEGGAVIVLSPWQDLNPTADWTHSWHPVNTYLGILETPRGSLLHQTLAPSSLPFAF